MLGAQVGTFGFPACQKDPPVTAVFRQRAPAWPVAGPPALRSLRPGVGGVSVAGAGSARVPPSRAKCVASGRPRLLHSFEKMAPLVSERGLKSVVWQSECGAVVAERGKA